MRIARVLRAVFTAVLISSAVPMSFAQELRDGDVVPNMPAPTTPIVTLTAPAPNATVFGVVTFTATVDLRGSVLSTLRYEVDGSVVGACPGGTICSVTWDTSTASVGSHSIVAVATNTMGQTGRSFVVRVTVAVPAVTIVEPLPSTIAVGKATLRAEVELFGRTLDTLSYQIDGTTVGTCDPGAICSIQWDTTTVMPGWHSLVAIATVVGGGTGRSTTIFVRTTVPAVRSIELQYGGYFLKNTDVLNPATARVNWDGHQPGSVEVRIGDGTPSIESADDLGAKFDVSMADFAPSRDPSVLRVRAKAADEVQSEELTKEVWVFEYPQWVHEALRSGGSLEAHAGTNEIVYAIEAEFPQPHIGAKSKVEIPSWVPFLGGRMGFHETYATIEGGVSSRGGGSFELSGTTGFEVGGLSIDGNVGGSGEFRMGTPRGLSLTSGTFGFQLRGSKESKYAVKKLPGFDKLKKIPVFGKDIARFLDKAELRGEVGAALGFGAGFGQNELTSSLEFREGTGTIELDVQGGLHVEINHDVGAELFVGGSGEVTIGVPERNGSLLREISGRLQVGATLELDGLANVSAKATFTIFCVAGATCDADVLEGGGGFVTTTPMRITSAPIEKTLVVANGGDATIANVFRNARPSVVAMDDGAMVLWAAQNVSLPVLQSTEIAWMRFDGSTWSAPSIVQGDTRADLAPVAAMDRTHRVVAAWVRVKDPAFVLNGNDEDVARYYAQFEVVTAVFDPDTNRWSGITPLTNDIRFDTDLHLAHDAAGNLLLTWLSFDDASRATLRASFWSGSTWSAPVAIATDVANVSRHAAAIDGDSAFVIVSRDPNDEADGDAVLDLYRWNGVVWSSATTFASGTADHTLPIAEFDARHNGHVFWLRGTELVHAMLPAPAPRVLRENVSSTDIAELVVVPDASGHFTLLWREKSRTGATTLKTSDFDPATHVDSEATALSDGQTIAQQASAVAGADGALRVAYVTTTMGKREETVVVDGKSVTIPNLPATGLSDLHVVERALLTDLVLHDDDLTFTPSQPAPGAQTTASIDVHNGGRMPATSFAVALYAGAPERGGTFLGYAMIDLLEGGAHRVVDIPFVNPGNKSLIAVVDAGETVRESDETNNRAIAVKSKRRAVR